MKPINHRRNAVRFIILLFWLAVVGLFYSAFQNYGNTYALSWVTWLFYAAVVIAVLYSAVVLTVKYWSFK